MVPTTPEDPVVQIGRHRAVLDATAALVPDVLAVSARLIEVFAAGGTLYTFGNGGSAADAQHLASEFVGRYLRDREPLPAHALTVDPSAVTSIANDYGVTQLFARQVRAAARPGDMVVGFTTSGRSPDVVEALAEGRRRGATTVLLGGGTGLPAAEHADFALIVDSAETARVQEMHVLLLHLICEQVDAWAASV